MADIIKDLEREYVIPLRESLRKVPSYKRTAKSIKTIKEFIAKHMKVVDRDLSKIKLDVYFNNEIWSQGTRRVLPRVKVKAKKDKDGNVFVDFVEVPKHVGFLKAKQTKRHAKPAKAEPKKEEKKEEGAEKKVLEAEKEKSVAEAAQKEMQKEMKAQKHTQTKKEPEIHRQVLKK